jgi:hypothetical protein
MDGFKSIVRAVETMASFPNFLGAIHFPFDRKTKNTVSLRTQIPGHFKTPNCAEMTMNRHSSSNSKMLDIRPAQKTGLCERLDQDFPSPATGDIVCTP